ncbi:TPA: phage baseplate assembly protein V, partial [Neisseria gonorrhoeae]
MPPPRRRPKITSLCWKPTGNGKSRPVPPLRGGFPHQDETEMTDRQIDNLIKPATIADTDPA